MAAPDLRTNLRGACGDHRKRHIADIDENPNVRITRACRVNTDLQCCLCRFQNYEETEEGVEVSYTEAGEPKHLRCKLLVGADGYFSAVRQQCLQDGPPDFAVSPPGVHSEPCTVLGPGTDRHDHHIKSGSRVLREFPVSPSGLK